MVAPPVLLYGRAALWAVLGVGPEPVGSLAVVVALLLPQSAKMATIQNIDN